MIKDYKTQLEQIRNEVTEKTSELTKIISDKQLQLQQIDLEIKKQEKQLKKTANFVTSAISKKIDQSLFIDFLKKPYKIKQIHSKKYEIYVPKWVPDFQVGWLTDDDGTWFTYEVNQYSAWLGDIPSEIAEKLELESGFDATVEGNKVTFKEEQKKQAEELFKGNVLKWDLDNATIKQGKEFDVILKIIQSGHIPYKQTPVKDEDKRKLEIQFGLRPYQQKAIDTFHKTGAIGVYYPTGAGKSFIAMYGMDEVNGRKIIVTTKTLIGQWQVYFEKYAPRLLQETDLVTYELLRHRPEYLKRDYAVAVFDECHKLPANSFSKLSLINCKYRIGLSASPHREDGREDMIFALTGYPIGLNWKTYMETVKRKYHSINIHIVKYRQQKLRKVQQLLDTNKKTFIFSDSIELGKQISNNLGIPFVYGDTEDRYNTIQNNRNVIISRVGDLGVSANDLQRIIEVDFLYGSRQQEIQRTGRLMHSTQAERHDIIMTEKEFEQYGKRIWILEEKGFHVKILETNK